MYDETGKFLQSRSSAIDYTSQRKALNQIEQLNKELESFSYSVSHDLRAPLRSIDGYTQILIDDYGKQIDAEGNRLMKIVINNARRMAQLIDDLLDFSRVGRKEIAKTSISTENMVKSIISEIQSTEQSRQLEFSVNNLPASFGDASLLRQVWYNLISNAVKYTGNIRGIRQSFTLPIMVPASTCSTHQSFLVSFSVFIANRISRAPEWALPLYTGSSPVTEERSGPRER
jgi:light-regulated signal transduction histidine kinase (bacteriophytochrome)